MEILYFLILLYIIILLGYIQLFILNKYKLKEECWLLSLIISKWYECYEVDINSNEFIKDNRKIQSYWKRLKYLIPICIILFIFL